MAQACDAMLDQVRAIDNRRLVKKNWKVAGRSGKESKG
jgi:hypothetical protein